MWTIDTVAVLGATDDGAGFALCAALAGCAVRLHDEEGAALARAQVAIRRAAEVALGAGAITPTERQRILDGVLFTPDLDEAVTAADLVLEAASGALAPWPAVAERVRATSALAALRAEAAEQAARSVPQPGRVVALRVAHGPGPLPGVELGPCAHATPHVVARARAFVARVNRAARVTP
jgi:3-hydroxyacyl-CoA dehydrogenase